MTGNRTQEVVVIFIQNSGLDHLLLSLNGEELTEFKTHYGGTLSVEREGKKILFYTTSKAWTPTASRYYTSRLELIAALKVIDEFKMDLVGRSVTLYVDNAKVHFILNNP